VAVLPEMEITMGLSLVNVIGPAELAVAFSAKVLPQEKTIDPCGLKFKEVWGSMIWKIEYADGLREMP